MQERRVWALSPADNADLRYLRAAGCLVRRCESIEALGREALRADMQSCEAALLMADAAANCRTAHLVRDMNLPLDLVAFTGPARRGEIAALLRVGVDCVMRQGDPPTLLAGVLHALRLRRLDRAGSAPAESAHAIGPWTLEDQGWRLQHCGGASMRLTVSERAVLVCLFEAPGHVASHAMLNQALMAAWRHAYGNRTHDPKPRGIISRLRWRGLQAGMEPPIESLRSYGYVWEI